jgi:6-phosphofructokinase 1
MRIGVMCSGGDAPGMNPCLRGIVRAAVSSNNEVIGFMHGWQGIVHEEIFTSPVGEKTMSLRSVSGLSMQGGTILHSSRCPEFRKAEGMKKAADNLRKHRIDALLTIGGNGTLRGANEFAEYWDGQIIGLPGTIDNDLLGTDFTIGFSTAVQTAVEAVDKLRDTAGSHDRMFLVEVMGRHSGYIALFTAIAAGAEYALIPEQETRLPRVVEYLHQLKERGKTSLIMVVAEGDDQGGAEKINKELKEAGCPFSTRVVVLGHLQRGGRPVSADRILASELGHYAVKSLLEGETKKLAGKIGDDLVTTPIEESFAGHKTVPQEMIDLLDVMAS